MLDEKTLRKKVFLRLLGHPLTIAPFMIGMTAMTASWAMNWQPSVGLFLGLAGALGSVGAYFSQLMLKGESTAQAVIEDAATAGEKSRQEALDGLERRLVEGDDDPRPEVALRELRALMKEFEAPETEGGRMNAAMTFEIRAMSEQLFDRCVESLRQSDRLWTMAARLQTGAARDPILRQREKIIAEVEDSIRHLSGTLVTLQGLDGGAAADTELRRLRAELDQSLAIAKTVEERVNALVNNTARPALEPGMRQNSTQ